jgi:hypothetical protein
VQTAGRLRKRREIDDGENSILRRSLTLPGRSERELSRPFLPSRVTPPAPPSSRTTSSVTTELSRQEPPLPTPSLCSDNEVEGSFEDRPPPTPPPPFVTNVHPHTKSERSRRPSIREIMTKPPIRSNVSVRPAQMLDAFTHARRQRTPEGRNGDTSERNTDAFAKRLPTSPMPQDTPRRPRPPSRSKGNAQHVITTDSLPSIDTTLSSLAMRGAPIPVHDNVPIGVPTSPTEICAQSRSLATASYKQRDPANVITKSISATAPRRRDTLHDELLRAEPRSIISHLDDDAELDREMLAAAGIRDSRNRFLAHGGGGGAPAYVDNGGIDVSGSKDTDWRVRVQERILSQSQLRTHSQKQAPSRLLTTKSSRRTNN